MRLICSVCPSTSAPMSTAIFFKFPNMADIWRMLSSISSSRSSPVNLTTTVAFEVNGEKRRGQQHGGRQGLLGYVTAGTARGGRHGWTARVTTQDALWLRGAHAPSTRAAAAILSCPGRITLFKAVPPVTYKEDS